MRKLVLVLLLAAALPLAAKSAFSGVYAVNGTNPGAGPYKGTLTIAPRGDIYDVAWSIGNAKYGGVGVVSGDTLSVAYSDGSGKWMGVVAYRARPDGTLDGKWAVYGGNTKTGTETATRK
ncbi:MAG TPA: fibronectin-binding protein [Thermoanaerobaculia bacterium]|nr:fibronectin-binding protein [Thermoanaerobaculia bacterium]